jgi:hypothetical protein
LYTINYKLHIGIYEAEEIVAYLNVLLWHCLARVRKNHNKPQAKERKEKKTRNSSAEYTRARSVTSVNQLSHTEE